MSVSRPTSQTTQRLLAAATASAVPTLPKLAPATPNPPQPTLRVNPYFKPKTDEEVRQWVAALQAQSNTTPDHATPKPPALPRQNPPEPAIQKTIAQNEPTAQHTTRNAAPKTPLQFPQNEPTAQQCGQNLLTPNQLTAASLLIAGQPVKTVAATLHAHPYTISRWKRNPALQAELRRQAQAPSRNSNTAQQDPAQHYPAQQRQAQHNTAQHAPALWKNEATCHSDILPLNSSTATPTLSTLPSRSLQLPYPMPARLLIVDDEPSICFALSRFFQDRGDEVFTSPSAEDAIAKLSQTRPDAIFLDIRLPGVSGLEAMERLTSPAALNLAAGGQDAALPPAIIVMTAHGTMEAAIDAMRQGAYDYLIKPVSLDRAAQLIDRLMESRAARKRGQTPFSSGGTKEGREALSSSMVGASAPMQELFKQIGAVAGRTMPVLILGETGSGKELVARAVHAHGPRSGNPFVAINAAALPETLIESELFGFEKGAFTGADRKRAGRFEEANTGTLFLDEIGELPLATQAKLLRFLDEPVITRLGGNQSVRLDVRLITATHRDLQDLVSKNLFRADLLYRLNVARIRVPPLRERREDVPALAEHFLKLLTHDSELNTQHFPILAEETLIRLRQYDWPGNVRELRNVLQQALLVARDGVILPSHLPPLAMPLPGDDALARRIAAALDNAPEFANDAVMNPIEKELLRQIMERHAGNLSRAAEHLGLHRATLRTKLRQHGLAEEGGK